MNDTIHPEIGVKIVINLNSFIGFWPQFCGIFYFLEFQQPI